MLIRRLCKTIILLLIAQSIYAQAKDWTKDEEQYYKTIKSLFEYFKGRTYDTTQRDYVFDHFVFFDNNLNDSSKSRLQERLILFDTLFIQMTHFVDSVGIGNLEAKPTYLFRRNKSFFTPYEEGGELNKYLPLTLTYYDKRRPNKPIGTLLFEQKTHKLLAWIIINQGGHRYFLTFNLV
jgi:hypothetical protein